MILILYDLKIILLIYWDNRSKKDMFHLLIMFSYYEYINIDLTFLYSISFQSIILYLLPSYPYASRIISILSPNYH